jgi:FkbM family methyltransferase
MDIPIIIVCYNNHKYVDNTINQITKINSNLKKNIIILNNSSIYNDTIAYLNNIDVSVITVPNNGPWISIHSNNDLYNKLPDKYILTDPDLEFNKDIPSNFIEILSELSDKYSAEKIGFALRIDDYDKMHQDIMWWGKTIPEGESVYWSNKINDNNYELYNAPIDTTFCLNNKNNSGPNIRVAGNFTARHLPWYIDDNVLTVYDKFKMYLDIPNISSFGRVFNEYLNNNYFLIKKYNETIILEKNNNDRNINWWLTVYSNWESETFNVFDNYLDTNKVFIDIGGWIGTTCIYGSRKSKQVYVVEADKKSAIDLKKNCKINSDNITVIEQAIYHEDDKLILFGSNQFLNNSSLNDSTSHIQTIYSNTTIDLNDNQYYVNSITINKIINDYNIIPSNISLIKVDIEGGEEHILNELFYYNKTYNIPIYVSFHYTWWNDKNLNRFPFIDEHNKSLIINNPFISILFN